MVSLLPMANLSNNTFVAKRIHVQYAQADQEFLNEFLVHLNVLQTAGLVHTPTHRGLITPGRAYEEELNRLISEADVLIFLISANLIAENDLIITQVFASIAGSEMEFMVPILIRACAWEVTPFGQLQILPRNHVAVVSWLHRDDAWTEILADIRRSLSMPRVNSSVQPSLSGIRARMTIKIETNKPAEIKRYLHALRILAGDASLRIVQIEEGSIILKLEGKAEGISLLNRHINDGSLSKVLGAKVEELYSNKQVNPSFNALLLMDRLQEWQQFLSLCSQEKNSLFIIHGSNRQGVSFFSGRIAHYLNASSTSNISFHQMISVPFENYGDPRTSAQNWAWRLAKALMPTADLTRVKAAEILAEVATKNPVLIFLGETISDLQAEKDSGIGDFLMEQLPRLLHQVPTKRMRVVLSAEYPDDSQEACISLINSWEKRINSTDLNICQIQLKSIPIDEFEAFVRAWFGDIQLEADNNLHALLGAKQSITFDEAAQAADVLANRL